MCKGWRIRVKDALNAIDNIKKDVDNLKYDDFCHIRIVRQATQRNIEIIGEALNLVPKEIQLKYPQIEWSNIIGMKNYLIHQYFDTVPDNIQEVATVHIINLENQLMKNFKLYFYLLTRDLINNKTN